MDIVLSKNGVKCAVSKISEVQNVFLVFLKKIISKNMREKLKEKEVAK